MERLINMENEEKQEFKLTLSGFTEKVHEDIDEFQKNSERLGGCMIEPKTYEQWMEIFSRYRN